jgi:hypothetical protein
VVSVDGVVEVLLVAGVWLLAGGVAVLDEDWLDDEDCGVVCGEFVSCGPLAFGGVELLAGGVLVLGEVLLLGGVLVSGGLVLVLGLVMSGVVLLDGGVVVLGDVLLLGEELLVLGLFTSLCGMEPVLLPVPLQSAEIIFTLLTLIEFELEDDGLALPAAVPVALPLPEVEPITWIM